jgi:uncharacterized protein
MLKLFGIIISDQTCSAGPCSGRWTTGATVYCFGSRARGNARAFSDVDLMVVSDKNQARLLARIRETLEDSNFPYVVDIVQERDCAESYRANYLAERVLLTEDMADA